jgi:ferredoxin-NADP reductase
VLPDRRPPAIALLSAGSGITPVLSMLRTLADDGYDGDVAFVHHARSGPDVLYGPEVERLVADRAGWRRLVVTEHDRTGDHRGRFAPAHLEAAGIDPAVAVAFACGPPPYLESVAAGWAAAGGSADRFRTESYGLSPSPTRAGGAAGTVRFAGRGAPIDVTDDGRPLLLQAEAAGLAPAHGCRRGICRSCVRPLVAGSVVEEGGVRVAGGPGSTVRLCVGVADGDVEVDL